MNLTLSERDLRQFEAVSQAASNVTLQPVGNSGYTIGTLQTDFGAHPADAVGKPRSRKHRIPIHSAYFDSLGDRPGFLLHVWNDTP